MATSETSGISAMVPTSLVLLGGFIAYFLVKLRRARQVFIELQKLGMPMPDFSFAMGHLPIIKSAVDTLPGDAHKVYAFGRISRTFPNRGAYYLDLWPLSEPFLIITSPTLASQVTQTTKIAYEKPDALRTWFVSISGGVTLFDSPGKFWKPLRALLNPGFSANHVMTLVPALIEETVIYCQTLRDHARKGSVFQLDPTTLRFTMDVIGRVVLNTKFGAQKGWNPLADTMLNQIQLKISNQETNPFQWLNFVRPILEWYNSRKMDFYINTELDKRYNIFTEKSISKEFGEQYSIDKSNSNNMIPEEQMRSVLDLILEEHVVNVADELDEDFRKFITKHVRMLLFAGHDSTSSTICYCYHLIYLNPTALDRLRDEHDSILGTDWTIAPLCISESPHLLNQLPYTTAVIKETLRLFPPATGLRQGLKGVDLVDEDGKHYPTENMLIWIMHLEMQRDARYWPYPHEFRPERWLVGPEDPLYPTKGAWRAFELGHRNCIGQALVLTEIKAVLALTVREFDIISAYDQLDKKKWKKNVPNVDGERAYQIEGGAAHPVDHYPCKVSLRKPNKAL